MTRKAQLLVAAVAIVVAGAVAFVLVLSSEDDPASQASNQRPAAASQAEQPGLVCDNIAILYLDTDEEMAKVADELRGDTRILNLETETKQQAYERFKVLFKDHPDLVRNTRPEALPASVWARPVLMSARELEAQLTAEFPNAELGKRPDVC